MKLTELTSGTTSEVVENSNPRWDNELVIHLHPSTPIQRVRLKWQGEPDRVFVPAEEPQR